MRTKTVRIILSAIAALLSVNFASAAPVRNVIIMIGDGDGLTPGMRYNSGSHSNLLVLLYARGTNAGLFAALVDGTDTVYGDYVDNTDIFKVMSASVAPEPSTIFLVGIGVLTLFKRKR